MQNEKEKFKKEFIQRLINFSLSVIKFCGKLERKIVFEIIIKQLIRSATSVGANVVETKSSSSRRDYIKFFEIALKSANETKYWLFIMKNIESRFPEVDRLLKEVEGISKVIASSILTLKGKKEKACF